MNQNQSIQKTKHWIEQFVIGMTLCPFAARPYKHERVRYVTYEESDILALYRLAEAELAYLDQHSPEEVETTLIIFTNLLQDFEDYLDFLDIANDMLEEKGYEGVFQIAGFHPEYRFDGEDAEDPSNYTNRSPYPMLHLLREDSVEAAVASMEDIDKVPYENMKKLRLLGLDEIKKRLNEL